MLALERHRRLLDLLNEAGGVRTAEAARALGVTEETVRRDFEKLEAEGALLRSHGGAVKLEAARREFPARERARQHAAEKLRIARAAAARIQPGQTILFDASTTALQVAKLLPDQPLTVVTNALQTALVLAEKPAIHVTVLGGTLMASSQSCTGWSAEQALELFRIDTAYISCRGLDIERGPSEATEEQSRLKRRIVACVEEVCLMADSSKVGLSSSYYFARPADLISGSPSGRRRRTSANPSPPTGCASKWPNNERPLPRAPPAVFFRPSFRPFPTLSIMSLSTHLAVDLGAGSGRVMAGHFDGRRLRLEEMNRFVNEGIRLPTGWHWKVLQLFSDIKLGLAEAGKRHGGSLVSVAVDTWGVDYALFDTRGRMLGMPWMYRDSRTDGMMDAAASLVPRDAIYRRTGIQFMFFNTLFQLLAECRNHPEAVAAADRLLFMPDLLTYWLSGEQVVERTIASTSQLLQAGKAEWDLGLAETLGIPARLLHPTTEPGTLVGGLTAAVRDETGCGALKVTTCGSHDTASAVAGIPASSPQPLFLSSGTWSLLGRELTAPMVTDETFRVGFSNEQGLNGTTRFLKNVAGMWLVQECKRAWDACGDGADYATLVAEAGAVRTDLLLNPDAEAFSRPCDMPAAIARYASTTGQAVPASRAETTRAILQSLALRYRSLLHQLRAWMPDLPDTLHVVGGGSQNDLLNQMTADATGLRVVAGPVEATALGNILAQLMATGEIASLEEGRALVRASFEPRVFEPGSSAEWDDKAGRFETLLHAHL